MNERSALRRTLALIVVGLGLGLLLVAGAELPGSPGPTSLDVAAASLLPAVNLSATGVSVWNCPGPLLVGKNARSSVIITNSGRRTATASIVVAESTVASKSHPSHSLNGQLVTASIPAASEHTVGLTAPTTAGVVDAAVSVTASGAGVSVSERSTLPAGRSVGAPCGLGSATIGLIPIGSTAGSSDERVALFDPAATPAVASIDLSTSTGVLSPQPLQGIAVAPKSVVVVDVGRYAVQDSRVAVKVTTTGARISIGALSTIATTFRLGPAHGATVHESGASLIVGLGSPLRRWAMPLGLTGARRSASVSIFNPGRKDASVTVSATASSASGSAERLTVPSGTVALVSAPILQAPRGTAASTTSSTTTSTTSAASTNAHAPPGLALGLDGMLTVTVTSPGAGVVVARETFQRLRGENVGVTAVGATARPAPIWLVGGAENTRAVAEDVLITNPGGRTITVNLRGLPEAGTTSSGAPVLVTTVTVAAGGSALVRLKQLTAKGAATFGLELRGDGPMLAEEEVLPSGTSGSYSVADVPAG